MNNRAIQNLTLQLQKSLDNNYDVVDMQIVLFVIQQLENTTITKEQLETTRLAKYINELRRRTSSEQLARRAKSLLKKWRDIFMPAIQQQSVCVPQPPTASSSASATVAVRNVSEMGGVGNSSQNQMQRMQSATGANANEHKYPTIVANNFTMNSISTNKILTGSANNTSSKHSCNLSNGGFQKQQQPMVPQQVESFSKEARMDTLRPRGSRTVSPIVSSVAGASSTLADRKQQPTSFANVLSTTQALEPGASSSAPGNSSLFNHCRSESPLPHIIQTTVNPRHRQSPVSLLDFDSNHSRPQINLSRARTLVNGDKNATEGTCGTVVDLHDSSSITIDLAGSTAVPALENQQLNQVSESPSYITLTSSSVVADVCSSSSNHRKNKKHKKEKKRSKQSEDAAPPTSILPSLASKQKPQSVNQGTASFLTLYSGEIQSIGDEELNNAGGDGAAFPPHDSLSSSSMSRFPSNISTNTMPIQNCSRALVSAGADTENLLTREESDLTFAGKFKSSNNNTGIGIINDSVTQSALKKSYSDSKDSSDVVVVESRSCSPFTTAQMGPDNSCSSSSRATIAAETLNLIADSNQEPPADTKSSLPQRLPQPAVVQQDQGLSSNSSQIAATVSQVSATIEPLSLENVKPVPKKRGRKKGSRGYDAVIAQTHAFLNAFERPRLLLGSKKVKTTKELLADIQNRKLGSSTTSSPTLVTSRQSVSPSTCSEASFQSDLTNTRASLPNLRSSPDVGALINCRQSDIDDINSATESNDAASLARSTKKGGKPQDASKLPLAVSSIDEYLSRLLRQLPAIDFSKPKPDEVLEIVCTCIVREVQPTAHESKEQVVIIKSDDEGCTQMKSPLMLQLSNDWPNAESTASIVAAANGPVVDASVSLASSFRNSPKRPMKSIFDLDYDEENDPLYHFVEAAKLHVSERAKDESNVGHDQPPDSNNDFTITENKVTVTDFEQSDVLIVDPIASPASQVDAFQKMADVSIVDLSIPKSEPIESTLAPEIMPPSFPMYEVVEDVNCLAKYRYEVQTNCVTEHHLNLLHNCYVANVNGCWSAPIPMVSEHRKRLRKYSSGQTHRRDVTDASISASAKSWWLESDAFLKTLQSDTDSEAEDQLFERVVPQYDHIIMDKVVKDLSQVKFTKNYMKKKLKRLKVEIKKAATDTAAVPLEPKSNESNSQRGASESKKAKKRKRTRTTSNKDADGNSDANDDACSATDKKHKHPRRRKRRKARDSDLETGTLLGCNLSRNDIKDAVSRPVGEEADIGDIRVSDVHELFPAENSIPKRIKDAEGGEGNCNNLQVPVILLHRSLESTNSPEYITIDPATKCHKSPLNFGDEDRSPLKSVASEQENSNGHSCDLAEKTDDHSCKQETVDAALIESSSNSSNSYTSNNNDINSDRIEANNQLTAAIVGDEEDSNSRDYSYCSGDMHKDTEVSELNEDVEGDEDYPGYEDVYGEAHNHDEEHEVVTHDMTSSTSTTSQQHIVLTIKKKILKPAAPSHARSDGTENGMFLPFKLSTDFDEDDDQLSIVTSSSTPTTIRIRRKNKQKTRPQSPLEPLCKYVERNQGGADENFVAIDSIDVFDNNNIKNGANVTLDERVNATEGCNEQVLRVTDVFTGDGVDREPPNLNGMDTKRTAVADEEHEEDSIISKPQFPSLLQPPSELVIDASPVILHQSPGAVENKTSASRGAQGNEAQKCDDHDLCDQDAAVDDNEPQLPKDNNGLLASFNELADDNFSGLRVAPDTQHLAVASQNKAGVQIAIDFPKSSSDSESILADANRQYLVQEFKEWHEVMQVPSYNDELLTILPYVVID